ncbi:uncharacterized protein LOC111704464 isoform X2 [Eurytemora carolleeae]|uniref:uncharacterized protein LOC111704464 isoform X2 n=1 Tax=Eurytemora carolleeae TaxID=1294199 RepID=UPI000C7919FB|nr:uncharacterized protein LOC111704464 isoform X2 [Eurytemora carolleeae]|eukprot:XP_023332471.1 uncharacterized protein LOC111704464 isoform X2 [Eurytemora affinis]
MTKQGFAVTILMFAVPAVFALEGIDFEIEEDEFELERQFSDFTIFFNGTLATILATLIAASLLGLLAYLIWREHNTGYGGYGGGYSGYGHSSGYSKNGYSDFYDEYTRRSGKVDDFTNQLYLLAEAFNKYEVTETECQLYVACESSQVPNQTGNLRLNKIVFQIMSNINTEENEAMYKDDPHMSDLMKAFKLGFLGSDCSRFRSKCSNPIV